jgi:hypothetical protein
MLCSRQLNGKSSRRVKLLQVRLDDAVMETDKAWAVELRWSWHIGNRTQWKEEDSFQKAVGWLLREQSQMGLFRSHASGCHDKVR